MKKFSQLSIFIASMLLYTNVYSIVTSSGSDHFMVYVTNNTPYTIKFKDPYAGENIIEASPNGGQCIIRHGVGFGARSGIDINIYKNNKLVGLASNWAGVNTPNNFIYINFHGIGWCVDNRIVVNYAHLPQKNLKMKMERISSNSNKINMLFYTAPCISFNYI